MRSPMTPPSKNFINKKKRKSNNFILPLQANNNDNKSNTMREKKDKNNEPPRYARCQSDFESILFVSVSASLVHVRVFYCASECVCVNCSVAE